MPTVLTLVVAAPQFIYPSSTTYPGSDLFSYQALALIPSVEASVYPSTTTYPSETLISNAQGLSLTPLT